MSATAQAVLMRLRVNAPTSDAIKRWADEHGTSVDAAEVVSAAEREGVAGILYSQYRRAALEFLDRPAVAALHASYLRTAALNLQRQHDLGEVLHDCSPAGIDIIVLKGMALLDDLYEDPGERPMTDIDLWIEPSARDPFSARLDALGYTAQPFYPDTFHRGPTVIEVHTDLLGSSRIRSRASILGDEEARIRVRAVPFLVGHAPARRLDPQDAVLFSCLHLLKHNACRLLWLLEIEALLRSFGPTDGDVLIERAHSAGQARALHQVAFLAGDMLSPRPRLPDAMNTDSRLGRLERRVLHQRHRRGRLPSWGPLLFFSPRRSLGGRVAFVFETLFPRPAVLRQIFEDRDSLLVTLYFRRFWQLVEMVVRH